MRIIRAADGALVVRVRPGLVEYLLSLVILSPLVAWATGGIARDERVAAALAPFLAGAALAYVVEIGDFHFHPGTATLIWRRWKVGRSERGEIPFHEIRAIHVHGARSPSSDVPTWVVTLTTASGTLALTTFRQSGRQGVIAARAIAEFLAAQGRHPLLEIQDP